MRANSGRRTGGMPGLEPRAATLGWIVAGCALILLAASLATSAPASAQTAATTARNPVVAAGAPSDLSAQRRRSRRAPTRLRIYPTHRALGPNAVRTCDAWYEQEYRPSGTVIVPRMRCRWING